MSKELAIVIPEVDSLVEMLRAFDDFKNKALTRNDYAVIKGKKKPKRSGWSKYALSCNVSTELREERVEERDGSRIYHFTYRAVHLPTGRYADAVGSASEREKSEEEWNHPEHDVRSLAQTRAYNRAISNLVGGGEISAEELSAEDLGNKVREAPQRPPPRPPSQVRSSPPPPQPQAPPSREDEVARVAESAGLDRVRIYTYGRNIHVDPTEPLYDEWQGYDAVLAPLGAEWNREAGRWEIPEG